MDYLKFNSLNFEWQKYCMNPRTPIDQTEKYVNKIKAFSFKMQINEIIDDTWI